MPKRKKKGVYGDGTLPDVTLCGLLHEIQAEEDAAPVSNSLKSLDDGTSMWRVAAKSIQNYFYAPIKFHFSFYSTSATESGGTKSVVPDETGLSAHFSFMMRPQSRWLVLRINFTERKMATLAPPYEPMMVSIVNMPIYNRNYPSQVHKETLFRLQSKARKSAEPPAE